MWTEVNKIAGKGLDAVQALKIPFIKSDREAHHFLHAVAHVLYYSVENSKDLNIKVEMGEIEYGSRPAYVDNSGIPAFSDAEGYLEVPVGAKYKYSVTVPLKTIAERLKSTIRGVKRMPTQDVVQALYVALNSNSPRLNNFLSSHYVEKYALGEDEPQYSILPTEASEAIGYNWSADYAGAEFEDFDFTILSMKSKGYGLDFSIVGDFYFKLDTITPVPDEYIPGLD